ncbi:putative integral membrane protein [Rosellinia necatrix]|uniref:Putative integral membrane protein n=1 Tax=Rosellinia necatrix TaxID=77044 RepID=A0A1S8A9L5_ROSNE|nr:putative integral membrane protein [Rosellinia necatrix]
MSLSIIFNWVQCTPVEKNFNVFVQGSCWPRETLIGYNTFASGYSGTVDFMLAFLPWKIIWKMDMSKKERFGAICAMSLGFFAGVISFVKIYALTGTFHADLDSSLQLTVLSVAETSITIMAASIPILRALARDKARPGGVKLFALNATEHVTLQGQPEPQLDAVDDEPSKADRRSRRVFRLVKKASTRRAPVLSNIMEIDELSPSMFGGRTAGERSFV